MCAKNRHASIKLNYKARTLAYTLHNRGKMRGLNMLEFINTYILGNLTPVFLMAAGIYFLFRLKFFYIRHPIKVLSAMLEKNKSAGISPFRAVTLALAGTLGVGNIVGVASAIAMGGYGAIFWMWVSALLAMILKYAEIVLAVSHRRTDPVSGEHYGGAMYYIRDLFNCRGHELCGILLAGVFALFCIINSLTMGCVVQINAISRSFMGVFDLSPVLIGAATALVCVFIISGNAKKISGFTEKIIPVITLGYLAVSVAALSARPDQIGDAFRVIFEQAFDFRSAAGGVLGFMFSIVFMDDWFDEIEDFSPAIFMIPFVIGMFCLFGGTVLNNLGRTGSIKHRNLQAHTIIINESTPVESIEEPKEEKKGGKCPNCGAPYKAKDKNCRYCGTDL